MKFETVRRVAVGDLCLEICWQIDNANGPKWAFLWADTTSDAQAL
jgi:hypothetical protein